MRLIRITFLPEMYPLHKINVRQHYREGFITICHISSYFRFGFDFKQNHLVYGITALDMKHDREIVLYRTGVS